MGYCLILLNAASGNRPSATVCKHLESIESRGYLPSQVIEKSFLEKQICA